jgi:N-acyl homoserine lactone hydrolase
MEMYILRPMLLMALSAFLAAACDTTSPTGPTDLKLYVFDCGSIELDDVSPFGLSNDETPVRELFVPCYLIVHGGDRLIWDAGLPLDLAGTGQQETQPGSRLNYAKSLLDQLAELGVDPSEIEMVAFSHMHFDHAGAANAFDNATLLIQETEYVAAFEHAETNPIFQPALYNELADNPRITLSGDHDVFGDGSVRIISAPGHTPGHQVLQLELANMGTLILSGDLYHFAESRALRRTPDFNTSKPDTLRSMDKVEAIIKATNATFWIEHERALADTLKLAPAYYD